ncbi:MAG: hypothetical protein CM15mP63_4810 [Gammaproteobacteria bacterium]|nr:MAG: hypothetical protein CM15mP63_4810 [Gammaproteobacteria bacterium]
MYDDSLNNLFVKTMYLVNIFEDDTIKDKGENL